MLSVGGHSFTLSSEGGLGEGIPTSEKLNQLFVMFNDGSTVEIMNLDKNPYYSNVDMTKGKSRNIFQKKYSPSVASRKLIDLYKKLGTTETNIGSVVLVDSTNVKTQIQL